jgi:DNA-binding NarL/FixJ family response regulator
MRKVIIADDHAITRTGVARLIESEGWVVVGQVESFDALITALDSHDTDIVISDCKMPGIGAANLLSYIQKKAPQVKLIFLSGMESALLYQQLTANNVNGLISKGDEPEDIIDALNAVKEGKSYTSKKITSILNNSPHQLTLKEFQVLELVIQGLSNPDIAKKLHNSPNTINTHRVSLMKKMNVNSVVDLVKIAHKNGLFDS